MRKTKRLLAFSLSLIVILSAFAFINTMFVGPVYGSPAPDNLWPSYGTASTITDLSVTDPGNAYDMNLGTSASFQYSLTDGSFSVEGFSNSTLIMTPPVPNILQVDFKMKYQATPNTASTPNDKYRIVYYVSPNTTAQVLVDWRTDFNTICYVDGFDDSVPQWTRVGSSPYLGAIDYPTNYINESVSGIPPAIIGDFPFEDTSNVFYNLTIQVYGRTVGTPNPIKIWLYDDKLPGYRMVDDSIVPDATWSWKETRNLAAVLDTTTRINNAALYIEKAGTGGNIYIDAMRIWGNTTGGVEEYLWVNGFDDSKRWTRAGSSPYLDAANDGDYVFQTSGDAVIGVFSFANLPADDWEKVYIEIYAKQDVGGDDYIEIWLYDMEDDRYYKYNISPTSTWSWLSTKEVTAEAGRLENITEINNAKVFLVKKQNKTTAERIDVDAIRLRVWNRGAVVEPEEVVWADQSEPNDLSWSWVDIGRVRFVVETDLTGKADTGCMFYEFEAYLTLTLPDAKLKVSPTTITTTSSTSTETTRPDGDSPTYQQWTGDYTAWDEEIRDDNDYVYTTDTGKKELSSLSDISDPGWSIGRVRVVAYARQTTGDERFTICIFPPGAYIPSRARMGKGASEVWFTPTTSFEMYSWDWGTNPDTEQPWTWSDINALEAGVESLKWGATFDGELRVSQLYVEVSGPRAEATIYAEDIFDAAGYQLSLRYNTSVLTIPSYGFATYTPFTSHAYLKINDTAGPDLTQGYISLIYNKVPPYKHAKGASGNRTLAKICFLVDAPGTTVLDLYATGLFGSIPVATINHDVIDGAWNDVAVKSVTPTATIAYKGYPRNITVTVENEGDFTEAFTVTGKYDDFEIGQKDVTLTPGATTTFNFTWDTTTVPYGDYDISVDASQILDEDDVADNSLTYVTPVRLTIPGDTNGDKVVTISDMGEISDHWTGPPAGPFPYALYTDINEDGRCGISDMGICSDHWGEFW